MELRYRGFDQKDNIRTYKFDGLAKGEPAVHFLVTCDLAHFREYHIGIQEGPSLCALKLASETGSPLRANLELTGEDLRAHADALAQAAARRNSVRRPGPRRRHEGEQGNPAWPPA